MMKLISLTLLLPILSHGFVPNTHMKSAFRREISRVNAADTNSGSNANELVPLKKGSSCALITPMTPNGDVDTVGLKKLLQLHLDAGTDNLCVLGTTAEASVLSMKERATILKIAVDMCKGKIPLLIGTGTINPNSVREMTMQAMDLGCDASLLVTPYYVKPPQRGLIRHFIDAADLGLPVVMYNVPGRTGVNFLDENIVLCSQHENVVGLKDATGDLSRLESVLNLLQAEDRRDDLLLYSGDDGSTIDFCLGGGDGCISVTANVAPKIMHQMVQAAITGQADVAKKLNEPLERLHKQIFCESNPIPAKWSAKKLGLIQSAYCRPPLDEMDSKYEVELESVLRDAGLLGYNVLNLDRTTSVAEVQETENVAAVGNSTVYTTN